MCQSIDADLTFLVPEASISISSWRLLCIAIHPLALGHLFCLLSGNQWLYIPHQSKMYYFYSKVNLGHVACLLYGFLRESVMGGSTVNVLESI